jgi:hypothetical protein
MGFFRNVFDGLLSLGAALLSSAVFALPVWATHAAVQAGLVPVWVYAALVGLVYIGANLTIAFLRKALEGTAPLRERKR